jgi:hypothetical protein
MHMSEWCIEAQQRIQGKEYCTFETKIVKNLMCNILRNFTYSEPFTAIKSVKKYHAAYTVVKFL